MPRFEEIFQNFDANVQEKTEEFQSQMKTLHNEKNNMVIYCQRVLSEAEVKAEEDSITSMQAYESYMKHKMRKVKEERKKDLCDFDNHEDEFMGRIDLLEDELMTVEMKLQDVLGQATMEY